LRNGKAGREGREELSLLPISVIVPHRNRSDLIGIALESIRRQTAQASEIIIVDDGSHPKHRAALAKYSTGTTRIVYLDKGRGPAPARNAGIEAATQEWIAFLDDDDEWLPGKLERQWNTLRADESLSGVASAMTVVSGGRADCVLVSHSPEIMTLPAALAGTVAMLQTAIIRASAIRKLQGFDPAFVLFEDKEFWIRLTAAGYRVYYDKEPLAILNRHHNIERLTAYWKGCAAGQFAVIAKHRALYESIGGPGAVNRERSKCLRRVGRMEGGVFGRLIYACGCVLGGAISPLLKLATTGEMKDVPYVVAESSLVRLRNVTGHPARDRSAKR
jgi:glycosyltransferase involved in cell wall biosynthesis